MAGLVCPHCGVTTAFSAVLIEGGKVWEDESTGEEVVRHVVSLPAMARDRLGAVTLALAQCAGCGRLFVASRSEVEEDWQSVWPLSTKPVPHDVPSPIREAFRDASTCLAAGALGGCLLMLRTAVIRMQREQNPGNLQELESSGKISQLMRQQADEVRLWANVVGHEDFPDEALTGEACEELLEYVRSLLDTIYVQPARLARHTTRRKHAKSQAKKGQGR